MGDPEVLDLFDGDVKKFVNDVLASRQHYLKRDRVDTGDPEVEQYEYTWGERAKLEVKESDFSRWFVNCMSANPGCSKSSMTRLSTMREKKFWSPENEFLDKYLKHGNITLKINYPC